MKLRPAFLLELAVNLLLPWLAYRLAKKGEALRPVLKAMRDWGLEWEKDTRVMS